MCDDRYLDEMDFVDIYDLWVEDEIDDEEFDDYLEENGCCYESDENRLWNEMLDDTFCSRDIYGNRPCDNGAICDRCHAPWFLEEYNKRKGE